MPGMFRELREKRSAELLSDQLQSVLAGNVLQLAEC